eukprot:TRINITY_DN6166_c0_g3_i1.p1 TRINITY_DN6166_c0_g3~~TRINITY_DN6166_c0_g3_i1.p1  ORF type:complete len:385 (-),score=95.83 TRINITY_DN6166_c0_g3_i1:186-1340(-)
MASYTTLSLCYLLISLGLLAVLAASLRYLRRRRQRLPGDGLFVLGEWHPSLRDGVAFGLLVLLLLPSLLFATGFVLGGVLALAEGWNFTETFEYVLCNMCGMSAMVDLTPDTTFGIICDIAVSIVALLITSTALGLAAGFGMATAAIDKTPRSFLGFLRTLFIYVPILLLLLCCLTGALIAGIDGWAVSDGILFMIASLCDIYNGLTSASPDTDSAWFFTTLCTVIELCVGGVIIGIVGAHPAIASFIVLIEGEKESDDEDTSAVASSAASPDAEPSKKLDSTCVDVLDFASDSTASERQMDKPSKGDEENEQIPLSAHREALARLQGEHTEKVEAMRQELDRLQNLLAASQAQQEDGQEEVQKSASASRSSSTKKKKKGGGKA